MTKKYVTWAILIALNTAISMLIIIPIPNSQGFISLIDAGILASAFLLGPQAGFIVGACSAALLDIFSGYFNWAIFSFVFHGLQGLIAGHARGRSLGQKILFSLLSGIIVVLGYFATTYFMYGLPAAIAAIASDSIQVLVGSTAGLILAQLLDKRLPLNVSER